MGHTQRFPENNTSTKAIAFWLLAQRPIRPTSYDESTTNGGSRLTQLLSQIPAAKARPPDQSALMHLLFEMTIDYWTKLAA
jgi:hypothetical protein